MKEIDNLPLHRLRRLRKSPAIREMMRETTLSPANCIAPLFLIEGENKKEPIPALPLVYRHSIDKALEEVGHLLSQGVHSFLLFPVVCPSKKTLQGEEGWNREGLLCRAIRAIKDAHPTCCVLADVALDPFTTHGHDGILQPNGLVDNDETLACLVEMAVCQAQAGVDFVAPSDMMDGRVGVIRRALDQSGFSSVGILAYAAKYASSLYGPFRQALQVNLQLGDKKNYQMDPANGREALLEASLDDQEGADILLVKPALFYLDVLTRMRDITHKPLAAYHVSGEYAMVVAAHEKGLLHAPDVFLEALLSIKRAGASLICTYALPWILPKMTRFHS